MMTGNFKLLGMMLVLATFSFAGGASASAASFHSETEPTYFTDRTGGNNVFSSGETKVVCTEATFIGTSATKTAETQLTHPSYSGCTFLGEKASVDTAGCDYEVFASGRVDIECSCTNKIVVTTGACNLSFGSQTTEGGATYTNGGSGSSRDVTTHINTKATFSKSGPLCFLVSGTTGTYTGSMTGKGYSDSSHKNQVGIWAS